MREAEIKDTEGIARSREAAELLFDAEDDRPLDVYEPRNIREANAAIRRFDQLLQGQSGLMKRVLRGASGSANLLSGDRLQCLAEIMQNAADAGASQVRLLLTPTDLLATHDGRPVRLNDLLGFATPWLSTKSADAALIGRFGIGLMTLRVLSATMEVHCPPYHVQIGDPTISPVGSPTLPSGFQDAGWTTLRIPLEEGSVNSEELVGWLDSWDASALLFLRGLSRVTLLAPKGETLRELTLERSSSEAVVISHNPVTGTVLCHQANARDGRSWAVYRAEVESPEGVSRTHKATGAETTVSVALPLGPAQSGAIYAGLPVAPVSSPLFVNAQFDPLTSRLDFADNDWNRALIPLVAKVWSHAALDLFVRNPKIAWLAIPVAKTVDENARQSFVEIVEEEITKRARGWLSSHLSFQVYGKGFVHLSDLAVEAQPLEHILTEPETAALAELPATLPTGTRDEYGRWREVLEDWRCAGSDLPEPVSVERALDLMRDEHRSVDSTIALAAIALEQDLGERLKELPCVIAHDGRRHVPPSKNSPHAVARKVSPLGQKLGLVTVLHDAHLVDGGSASTVLKWLKELGALLDGSDDRAMVCRLAAAGQSGYRFDAALTDEQALALREAFELLNPSARAEVGTAIGGAILLEAYTYDGRRPRRTSARPAEAYLPRRIDRDPDSFAIAAEKTPNMVWISERYSELLRSPVGRQGVGAQRFLRLLGAETVPRVRPHPGLQQRFSGLRTGLHKSAAGSPELRRREMSRRDATYTLQDFHSPDLQAVAEDIAGERLGKRRRRRAAALLATLGRAWERYLTDFAVVESAYDYFQWQIRGQLRAFWLWQLGDTAWLDDESGHPRKPDELRVRTAGNVAIYGDDSPDYLHKELNQPNREDLFKSIGISGDPTRSELVDRLRRLRDSSGGVEARLPHKSLKREAAIVYQALARDLALRTTRSDLNTAQLRSEFQQGQGLILTNLGWLPPRSVLAGPRIFRGYRAFAPQVDGVEPLWNALNLREPLPEDCLRVIHRIARKKNGPEGEDETILLETLRALASHYRNGSSLPRRRLSQLALWTSRGWMRNRPVYATDDPILAKGLRSQLPLWEPGGDLDQFRPLLESLRVEEIRAEYAEVIDPNRTEEEPEDTELFRNALNLLQEDLARNDPLLAASILVPWDTLSGFDVRIHPSLSLRVRSISDGAGKKYISEIDAKVDASLGSIFIRNSSVLQRVDSGGRALAALFEGNTRRLAQAWRAACDRAEEGIEARRIELARQRDARERAQMAQEIGTRTSSFRDLTASSSRGARSSATGKSPKGNARSSTGGGPVAIELGPPRTLVDPDSLEIVDPRGRIEKGKSSSGPKKPRDGKPVEPGQVSTFRRNRTPLRGYSDQDKEDVGMRLVNKLLSSDKHEIVDLRNQRNVGADAVDKMERFYELKVSAGSEPDQVRLTSSEFQRAKSDDKFFLIVVSGIEGVDAQPRIRVFVDPLNQLQQTFSGPITLSGVLSTESLVYEFDHVGGETSLSASDKA